MKTTLTLLALAVTLSLLASPTHALDLETGYTKGLFMPAMVHAPFSTLITVYAAVNSTAATTTKPDGFEAKVVLRVCDEDLTDCSTSHTLVSTATKPITYYSNAANPTVGLTLSSSGIAMGAFAFGDSLYTFACPDVSCSSVAVTNHTVPGLTSDVWKHVRVVRDSNDVMTIFYGDDANPLNICRCSSQACSTVSCVATSDDFFSFDVRMSSEDANGVPVLAWFTSPATRCGSFNTPQFLNVSVCADMACTSFSSAANLLSDVLPCNTGVQTSSPVLSINPSTGALVVLADYFPPQQGVKTRFYSCPDTGCASPSQVEAGLAFMVPMSIAPSGVFFGVSKSSGSSSNQKATLHKCSDATCSSYSSTPVGIDAYQSIEADAAVSDSASWVVVSYDTPPDTVSTTTTTLSIFRGSPPGSGGLPSAAHTTTPSPFVCIVIASLIALLLLM